MRLARTGDPTKGLFGQRLLLGVAGKSSVMNSSSRDSLRAVCGVVGLSVCTDIRVVLPVACFPPSSTRIFASDTCSGFLLLPPPDED